jgi:ATP-dependent helicase HepA
MSWPSASARVKPRSFRSTRSGCPGPQRLAAEADEELARLTALKAVNPSVRDSEIDALRQQRDDGMAALNKAALRLEAIRVLVAG